MTETGNLLKKQREELGLSIPEVSRSLKIKPQVIEKIEEGLINEMSNKPFVRGFVKSYATFLRLDAQSVVKMLDIELGGEQKNKDIEDKAHNSGSWFRKVHTKKKPKNKKLIVFAVICAVAFIVANYSFKYLDDVTTSMVPAAAPIKSKVSTATDLKLPPKINPVVISAKRGPVKTKSVKEIIKDIESAKKTGSKVTYKLGSTGSAINFAKPYEPAQIPFADPNANPLESLKVALKAEEELKKKIIKKPTEPKKKLEKISRRKPVAPIFKQELRLYTTKATKIIFQIDKDIKRTINLSKGQTHRLKAFDKVWLSLEDAGSVFIFHNKKDLGKAGKAGETKEIIFDN